MKKYFIGIDVGTGQSKGVICNEAGEVLAYEKSDHQFTSPKPGFAQHDAEKDWWEGFCSISKALLARSKIPAEQVTAVATSTVSGGITAVDENGQALSEAILYGIDSRAQPEIDFLNNTIGCEKVQSFCGEYLSHESYGPKILWLKNNRPEIWDNTKQYTISQSYLNLKLTGRNVTDYFTASGTQPIYNRQKRCFDPELCKLIVPADMLPELCNSTDVIGYVCADAAAQTELAPGTPVVCGTTDAGAEALSVGVVEPGDLMIMYGSTMFLLGLSDNSSPDFPFSKSPYIVGNATALNCGTATAGTLTRWLRDEMYADRLQNGGGAAYDFIFQKAAEIPKGSDGVVVLPYFMGERAPIYDSNAKGIIFGLNINHSRDTLFRASLEGIAFGIEQCIKEFCRSGMRINKVCAVGGGAQNDLWTQIVSDICGIEQHVSESAYGACYGDAMLAALGSKIFESPGDIGRWIKTKKIISAESDTGAYDKNRRIFLELYSRNKELFTY